MLAVAAGLVQDSGYTKDIFPSAAAQCLAACMVALLLVAALSAAPQPELQALPTVTRAVGPKACSCSIWLKSADPAQHLSGIYVPGLRQWCSCRWTQQNLANKI